MLPPPKKVNAWTLKSNYELKETVKRLAFELNATFKVNNYVILRFHINFHLIFGFQTRKIKKYGE